MENSLNFWEKILSLFPTSKGLAKTCPDTGPIIHTGCLVTVGNHRIVKSASDCDRVFSVFRILN